MYDIKAKLYMQLSSGDEDGVVVRGDFDGDGWLDLAVEEEGLVETVRVYAGVGQRLDRWEMRMKPEYALAGDVDGDGRDEFLCLEGGRIGVYAVKKERTQFDNWPVGVYPSCCADLNGDGKDEIIGAVCEVQSPVADSAEHPARALISSYKPETGATGEEQEASRRKFLEEIAPYTVPTGGFLNPATGEFTKLQFPEGAAYPFNMFRAVTGEIVCCDINRDGQQEIIAKADTGSAIFIFDATGALIYHEEFGQPATAMAAAHAKDGATLVVQLEDGVRVYP